jgi:hypothetical protein
MENIDPYYVPFVGPTDEEAEAAEDALTMANTKAAFRNNQSRAARRGLVRRGPHGHKSTGFRPNWDTIT